MISELLYPLLDEKFPNKGRIEKSKYGEFYVFEPEYTEFGAVVVSDDGDEVIIFLGNFTHTHFSCYDELSIDEKEKRIAKDVAGFFEKLFDDRILVWGKDIVMGGWEELKEKHSTRKTIFKRHVWSGPFEPK